MKAIYTTDGTEFLVDDDDYDRLNKFTWTSQNIGYAQSTIGSKLVLLHQLVLTAPEGLEVDHINRNPKDNRRSNLRIVTRSQNQINRTSKNPQMRNIISRKDGIYVKFCRNYKNIYFGPFSDLVDATAKRDEWLNNNEPLFKTNPELWK